jgi:protein-tyrosine phosphatase
MTRVLFVCMANQCRSPLAEAIARQEFGGGGVEFASAGLMAGGAHVPPVGIRVADELEIDLKDHVSRQVDAGIIASADLVLTMERKHARALVAADPGLWPRVFTLKQFSRWAEGRSAPTDEDFRAWLEREAGVRPRGELLGSDAADDIDDPVNSPARAWRRLATELREHIRIVLDALPAADDQAIHSRMR